MFAKRTAVIDDSKTTPILVTVTMKGSLRTRHDECDYNAVTHLDEVCLVVVAAVLVDAPTEQVVETFYLLDVVAGRAVNRLGDQVTQTHVVIHNHRWGQRERERCHESNTAHSSLGGVGSFVTHTLSCV